MPKVLFAKTFLRAARVLPIRLMYAAGFLSGAVWAVADGVRRHAVGENARLVKSPSTVRDANVMLPFVHFHWTVLENIKFSSVDADWVSSHVTVHGLEHVRRLQEARTPAIHLTSHIGNWELGARITALLGVPLTVIVLETSQRSLEGIYQKRRSAAGLDILYAGKSAATKAIEALQSGRHLASVFDLVPNDKGLEIDWFGLRSRVVRGPFWLAQRAAAPMVPTFCVRKGMGKFDLIFEQPIFPDQEGFVETVARRMEHWQRKYWTQWAFFTPLRSAAEKVPA